MVSPTKKRVAVVLDLYQISSKGYFPELSELLQGIKSVRDKIKKKKKKKRGYLSRISPAMSVRPIYTRLLFSLKFETGCNFKIF